MNPLLDNLPSTSDAINGKSNKIKVAFVSPIGSIAGGERVLLEIAKGLQAHGHSAKVFCLREGSWTKGTWGRDVEVVAPRFSYRIRYPWLVMRTAIWLRRELRLFQPSIVHANHASWWIAAWALRSSKAATVWHLHDYPDKRDIATILGELSPATVTLFTTDHVASGYPKLLKRRHAIIAPVTVDPIEFANSDRDNSILTELGICGKSYFLTVCRWQPHKGIHELVTAADKCTQQKSTQSRPHYVIVGKPSSPSELAYQTVVKQSIAKANLNGSFSFVEDCTDSRLRSLYSNATALVHPALSEGFGLALLEAMSMGLPVIAYDAAGPSTILQTGDAGVLVPRGDTAALSRAMIAVFSDSSIRFRLREAAEKRAAELSKQVMVKETLELYESLGGL